MKPKAKTTKTESLKIKDKNAIQWTGSNTDEVLKFGRKELEDGTVIEKVREIEGDSEHLSVETLIGFRRAEKGLVIVKNEDENLMLKTDEQYRESINK